MSFNKELAEQMYGASTEDQLRNAITGERSGITDGELSCITRHVSSFSEPVVYCEVGVYFGGTFVRVLNHMKKYGINGWGIGIDLFEDLKHVSVDEKQTHEIRNKWNILNVARREDLERSLRKLKHGNFQLEQGDSSVVLMRLAARMEDPLDPHLPVDVMFLDGNHTYEQTRSDFVAALPIMRSGGVVVLHNASNDIEPDPRYVADDGGPWKVCEDIKVSGDALFVEQIERCQVFRVK